ncbi:hypothetical protein A2574_00745 [Candidatus Shapirobacteria bacterium RIFOXYD1_FULL_38_32]|uniref:Uncharacterized protein n=1 Tax=Candidatus Shapirobacteria bacterium GW2011_GWE1_38_92 TaxID=1618489 RepID=A0A0G0LFL7_9BACT|nr:MAG: hypothetical protein UT14_C0050G0008 [Candidatus Shapirobacteria bacterium GW2011_GWE1_38_92]OGL56371.1 MAG: hypothetical protein A2195_03225 [Candidatus Shapirobacteria bacterium RIFOXYA1_FULL_39_17]OGL56599.1 MAG: hypothetical protein A2410_01010 [Candidatus Shapirobacteria bacterium RIFOXYC1_FULL_38_24]OGL57989.1 MAG: hypothetical protein A2574_00745 [Candidatus Shapirobacteria bacterium RIFOXYD1_FULL_38_32]HAP37919.1 hypothetical protein [Candidatus Shapirobacteria bacterium]
MSEKKKFKLRIPGLGGTKLEPAPQPDYIALTNGQINSCHGCGKDCRRGSLPGGSDCTVQNEINQRRLGRLN